MKKKTAALFLALALVVGATIGGTIAWLTATTTPVVNTFTTSNIDITLNETDADKDGNANTNSYQMVPGYTIDKDPTVTVKAGSEKCYLFVKLDKENNFDTYLSYNVKTTGEGAWTKLNNVSEEVYYRIVDASDLDQEFNVLAGGTKTFTEFDPALPCTWGDNQLLVNPTVTKEKMNELNNQNYPKLIVTAYASQYMKDNTNNFSALEAWNNVPQG